MSEVKVYERPKSWMPNVSSHYCPGCGHGIAHRLVCEVIDELGIQNDTIGVAPVGCAAMIYDYMDTDYCEAPHGRAPAVATGLKTVRPDKIVYTYQGDGDLASIGMGELIHAAGRAENITIIFINNGVFGMTQGQMAPTTLLGMKTTTTPRGRDAEANGLPMQICELLQTLPGVAFLARETMTSPKNVRSAKKSIKKAFEAQVARAGFSLVELVSTCPTWWGKSPLEAAKWLEEEMLPQYPLGVFKDWTEGQK